MTKKDWENLKVNNNITIEDKCSLFYPQFENIKKQFLKYFDLSLEIVNFDKFVPSIKKETNEITNYITNYMFNGDNALWNEGDTEDWLLSCFFKVKKHDNIELGYIIQLYHKNKFQQYFCSTCKKTLANLINDKIKYLNAKKRKCAHIISLEDDNMEELQDLKDYLESINDYLTYMSFALTLNKQENVIVSTILAGTYKTNETIDPEKIMKKINVKKRRFQTIIKEINSKWNQYIVENKLK